MRIAVVRMNASRPALRMVAAASSSFAWPAISGQTFAVIEFRTSGITIPETPIQTW